jgi:hypothetical protein
MATALTPGDLSIIYQAALRARIDPSTLKTKNPFEADASPTAIALRAAIQMIDPAAAERLSDAAGTEMTLATAAYLAGSGELSAAVRKELAIIKPSKLAEIKAAEHAEQYKRFEEDQAQRREAHAQMQEQIQAQSQDAYIKSLQLVQNSLRPDF